MQTSKPKISYADAGVDIDNANEFIERIKPHAKRTHNNDVLGHLGGFAGLYQLPSGYHEPVLVSATDGVGTKLCLAHSAKKHHGIGIDLVAMCANDLICCGAKPLYFLDYYATGKLDADFGETIIESISQGCTQAGMALIGGETAEMPSVYQGQHYDLAGFAVGVVEKSAIINPAKVTEGMQLVGLASSGCHANGYSLIRKLIHDHQVSLTDFIGDQTVADCFLTPTKIYVKTVQAIQQKYPILAMAHITGGGFQDNLERILSPNITLQIDTNRWQRPTVFNWLQEHSQLEQEELFRTFNMGIGFAMIVAADDVEHIIDVAQQYGDTAFHIGHVTKRQTNAVEFI